MLHLWMLLLPLMRSSRESSLTSSELTQATNCVRFLDYICFYIVIINVRHQEVHTYAWIVENKIYTVSYGCGNQSLKLGGWVVLWLPYPASTASCPIRNKNGTETAQSMNIHVVKEQSTVGWALYCLSKFLPFRLNHFETNRKGFYVFLTNVYRVIHNLLTHFVKYIHEWRKRL